MCVILKNIVPTLLVYCIRWFSILLERQPYLKSSTDSSKMTDLEKHTDEGFQMVKELGL